MDKYGTTQENLLEDLRNEEHNLTLEVMTMMKSQEKIASAEYQNKERRLQDVRAKITELDLGKNKGEDLV